MSANSNAKEFRKRLGTHDADINAIVDEMLATMERLEFELEAASKRQAASYKESVEMATLAAHEIEALRKERDELKERLNYYSYTMGESCERADDVLSAAMDVGAIASPAWVRRAGESGDVFSFTTDELERFAAIIEHRARESEREACARICYEARNQDVSPLVLYSRIRARADK